MRALAQIVTRPGVGLRPRGQLTDAQRREIRAFAADLAAAAGHRQTGAAVIAAALTWRIK